MNIAAVVQQWFATHSIQQLEHPPYLPGPISGGLLHFQKSQEGAGWAFLDEGTLKTTWEVVTRSIALMSLPLPSGGGTSVAKKACA
jgi:hypothetical protein